MDMLEDEEKTTLKKERRGKKKKKVEPFFVDPISGPVTGSPTVHRR